MKRPPRFRLPSFKEHFLTRQAQDEHEESSCKGGVSFRFTQWLEMFERQNAAVDIMSIHHYKDDKACWFNKSYCGKPKNQPTERVRVVTTRVVTTSR